MGAKSAEEVILAILKKNGLKELYKKKNLLGCCQM